MTFSYITFIKKKHRKKTLEKLPESEGDEQKDMKDQYSFQKVDVRQTKINYTR